MTKLFKEKRSTRLQRELVSELDYFIKNQNLNKSNIALKANCSRRYIHYLLKNQRSLSFDFLEKMELILGIEFNIKINKTEDEYFRDKHRFNQAEESKDEGWSNQY